MNSLVYEEVSSGRRRRVVRRKSPFETHVNRNILQVTFSFLDRQDQQKIALLSRTLFRSILSYIHLPLVNYTHTACSRLADANEGVRLQPLQTLAERVSLIDPSSENDLYSIARLKERLVETLLQCNVTSLSTLLEENIPDTCHRIYSLLEVVKGEAELDDLTMKITFLERKYAAFQEQGKKRLASFCFRVMPTSTQKIQIVVASKDLEEVTKQVRAIQGIFTRDRTIRMNGNLCGWAESLLRRGKVEEALAMVKGLPPSSYREKVLLIIAKIFLRRGQREKVVALVSELPLILVKVRLLLLLGDIAAAEGALTDLEDRKDLAVKSICEALLNRGQREKALRLANTIEHRGLRTEVIKLCNGLVARAFVVVSGIHSFFGRETG